MHALEVAGRAGQRVDRACLDMERTVEERISEAHRESSRQMASFRRGIESQIGEMEDSVEAAHGNIREMSRSSRSTHVELSELRDRIDRLRSDVASVARAASAAMVDGDGTVPVVPLPTARPVASSVADGGDVDGVLDADPLPVSLIIGKTTQGGTKPRRFATRAVGRAFNKDGNGR